MTRILQVSKTVCCMLLAAVLLTAGLIPSQTAPRAAAADLTVDVVVAQAGDINGDGNINLLDVSLFYHGVSGNTAVTIPENADLNHDGTINLMDAARLYQHVSGKNVLPPAPSDFDLEVLRYVNIEREKAGLQPLKYGYDYQAAADIRSEEIIQCWSHTRPDGRLCFTALDDCGNAMYYAAGENIAINVRSPEQVIEAWMNSPGHRANILKAHYTHLIVGSAPVADYEGYYSCVQLFYAC